MNSLDRTFQPEDLSSSVIMYIRMYICMDLRMYVCVYVWIDGWMYVQCTYGMYVCIQRLRLNYDNRWLQFSSSSEQVYMYVCIFIKFVCYMQ